MGRSCTWHKQKYHLFLNTRSLRDTSPLVCIWECWLESRALGLHYCSVHLLNCIQPSGRIQWSQLCLPMRFLRMLQLCHLPWVSQQLPGGSQTPTSQLQPAQQRVAMSCSGRLPLLADEPGNNLLFDIHGGSQVALANVAWVGSKDHCPIRLLLVPWSLTQWLGALSQAWWGRPHKDALAPLTQQRHGHSDESQKTHRAT